jgi:hypothetical protein
MTNTQNVTELQPRMTREQLIDAARKAAPLLPAAYGWMVNELANRLDYTSVALCEAMAQRKELAEQNATLREDVTSWAKECDRMKSATPKRLPTCTCWKLSENCVSCLVSSFP